jgi:hypothetical protein
MESVSCAEGTSRKDSGQNDILRTNITSDIDYMNKGGYNKNQFRISGNTKVNFYDIKKIQIMES